MKNSSANELASEIAPVNSQGAPGDDAKITSKDYIKFIILSIIGVFLFFIPVKGASTPIVVAVNTFRSFLGSSLPYIVIVLVVLLNVTLILGRVFKIKPCAEYHKNDGPFRIAFFIIALVIIILVKANVNWAPIQHPQVGGRLLTLASTVVTTIVVAGWAVVFMLKSGIVDFVGNLIEPLMRPLFRVPGEAAVDAMASFVSSASVGVYFTDQHYLHKVYTQKEAVNVAINYSVISLGFMAVLCSYNHIEDMYPTLIGCAFVTVLIMAMITCRIPPISLKKDIYVDGEVQTEEQRKTAKLTLQERWHKACTSAALASREFTVKEFFRSLFNAISFAQKIIAVQITLVAITLSLVYFTPLFEWLGKPMIPILKLLHMPNAAEIAPATLIGFIEVTLPSITVTNLNLAPQAGFFVALLSCCQIIFMSEAGNAMLSSSMPIKFWDLLFSFIVRTAIAIPICALISHMLF